MYWGGILSMGLDFVKDKRHDTVKRTNIYITIAGFSGFAIMNSSGSIQ